MTFVIFFLREPHILLVFINIREYIYKNKSKNSLDINNFDDFYFRHNFLNKQ